MIRPAAPLVLLLAAACSNDEGAPAAEADAGPQVHASGLPQACTRGAKATGPIPTCNGAVELCDRSYDRVVVPMTHNAMSNADAGWSSPNQTHGIARQLDDGIRGLMLDVHYFDTEARRNAPERLDTATAEDQTYLCHALCQLGNQRLLDGLCEITSFLDTHPGEVLSIIFETRVTDSDLDTVLRSSGLAEYAYAHPAGAAWPTLREMIDSGKRLVVFVETGGGDPPYLHPAFVGNIRDTPYTFENASDFSCRLNRGAAGDPLFLINHWLGRPLSSVAYAEEVNVEAVLEKRVTDCTAEVGRPPTFVGVDFYEVGDLFSVVKEANGL